MWKQSSWEKDKQTKRRVYMYFQLFSHEKFRRMSFAILMTLLSMTSHSETESPTQSPSNPTENCFLPEDISNLNAYFEALSTDPPEDLHQYVINFEAGDMTELKEHFQNDSFDSFAINHEEEECNQHLGLKIFFRLKVIEDDDVFYSESMWMYILYKRNGAVDVEFYAIAG